MTGRSSMSNRHNADYIVKNVLEISLCQKINISIHVSMFCSDGCYNMHIDAVHIYIYFLHFIAICILKYTVCYYFFYGLSFLVL